MQKDPRSHQNTQLLLGNFLGACEMLYTAKIEAQLITGIYHLSEPTSPRFAEQIYQIICAHIRD